MWEKPEDRERMVLAPCGKGMEIEKGWFLVGKEPKNIAKKQKTASVHNMGN